MENEEMMNDEDLVVEETTENVGEQATEEVVEGEEQATESNNEEENVVEEEKKYTEEELNARVNELLKKKLHRQETKVRKEYEKKYSQLENVISAGLNTNDMNEAAKQLEDFYEDQGVKIPKYNRNLSDREEEILAKAEADEIIAAGYEDIVEEVDRLADIGINNMSSREKFIFRNLAEKRKELESEKELLSVGADKNILKDEKYKTFITENGLENVPAKKAYELYRKLQPKPQVEQVGDLTNKNPKTDKEFISEAEFDNMSPEQIEKNLGLIRKSMAKW